MLTPSLDLEVIKQYVRPPITGAITYHLHFLHGGPRILIVHCEEKKIFALMFERIS